MTFSFKLVFFPWHLTLIVGKSRIVEFWVYSNWKVPHTNWKVLLCSVYVIEEVVKERHERAFHIDALPYKEGSTEVSLYLMSYSSWRVFDLMLSITVLARCPICD